MMDEDIKEICLRTHFDENDIVDLNKKIRILNCICKLLTRTADEDDPRITENFILDLINIVETNLFRDLPPPQLKQELINIGPSFDAIKTVENPQVEHLTYVYKVLYHLLVYYKDQPDLLLVLFDEFFVESLLSLIKCECLEEREYVAQVIALMYELIPELRDKIYQIVIEDLLEIIADNSVIYIYTEELLCILFFILNSNSIFGETEKLMRLLMSLHRLPYLYHFYVKLFSCCMTLLRSHPSHIVRFTKRILTTSNKYNSSLNVNLCSATNRMLLLVEIQHVLTLIQDLIDDNDTEAQEQFRQQFTELCPHLVNVFASNLKSHNIKLVYATIKLLASTANTKLFEPHIEMLKIKLLPILEDQTNAITWDYQTRTQQFLYQMYLESKIS